MKRRVASVVLVLAVPLTIFAHRLDEYLQATRLALDVDRIVLKMDLTPGAEIASLIFASINTNHDGQISANEGKVYANQVLQETVLEVDGKRRALELVSSQFPSFREMNEGVGVIRIEAHAAWAGSPGRHLLFFENHHRPNLGVYLVNALVPASRDIEITGQQRDTHQREIRLDFKIEAAPR
jgi:hypothetical protein